MGTHQMSELHREAPVGRFLDGHGFDVRPTEHKPAITGEEISAVDMVSGKTDLREQQKVPK